MSLKSMELCVVLLMALFLHVNCHTHIDECTELDVDPCKNGATCVNTDGSYQCACAPGWMGHNCTNVMQARHISTPEEQSPPAHSPTQVDNTPPTQTISTPAGHSPSSHNPLHGTNIATPAEQTTIRSVASVGGLVATNGNYVNECAVYSPCRSSGTCINSPDSYSCRCANGWAGTNYTIDYNQCVGVVDQCQNGGTCENKDGSNSCVCGPGWTGPYCNIAKILPPARSPPLAHNPPPAHNIATPAGHSAPSIRICRFEYEVGDRTIVVYRRKIVHF